MKMVNFLHRGTDISQPTVVSFEISLSDQNEIVLKKFSVREC